MRPLLVVVRPSSCTASAGGSFSVISLGLRYYREAKVFMGFSGASTLAGKRPGGDVTLATERESKHVPVPAVHLAARQWTAELPNRALAAGLWVSHVNPIGAGKVGLASRDEDCAVGGGGETHGGRRRERAKPLLECGPNVRCEVVRCTALPQQQWTVWATDGRVRRGKARKARDRLPKQGSKRRVLRWHWTPGFRVGLAVATFGQSQTEDGIC
jgi:hypothetical protein